MHAGPDRPGAVLARRDLTRAEHTARMLDGAFHADVAGAPGQRGIALSWDGVLAIIGAKPPIPGEEAREVRPGARRHRSGRDEVARLLTLDTDSPASIVSCVARARERGADPARRDLDRDVGGAQLLLPVARALRPRRRRSRPARTRSTRRSRSAARCSGDCVERTMLRDEGRAFLEAGGRIEEADMVLRMLRVAVPAGVADPPSAPRRGEALALLQASAASRPTGGGARRADASGRWSRFLLYDGAYPGSVASSVEALRDALSDADAQPRSSPPVLRLGRLIADLELQRRTPRARRRLGRDARAGTGRARARSTATSAIATSRSPHSPRVHL